MDAMASPPEESTVMRLRDIAAEMIKQGSLRADVLARFERVRQRLREQDREAGRLDRRRVRPAGRQLEGELPGMPGGRRARDDRLLTRVVDEDAESLATWRP